MHEQSYAIRPKLAGIGKGSPVVCFVAGEKLQRFVANLGKVLPQGNGKAPQDLAGGTAAKPCAGILAAWMFCQRDGHLSGLQTSQHFFARIQKILELLPHRPDVTRQTANVAESYDMSCLDASFCFKRSPAPFSMARLYLLKNQLGNYDHIKNS